MLNELAEVATDPGFIFVGGAAAILLLFVLGATNRVVIFANGSDFIWTAMIAIVPVVWMLSLIMTAGGEGHPTTIPAYDWASVKAQPIRTAYILLGLGLFAYAVLSSFLASVRHNPPLVGILIFAFKMVASLFLLLLVPSVLYLRGINTYGGRAKSSGTLVYMVLAGIGYLAYLLINGERVAERREDMAEA